MEENKFETQVQQKMGELKIRPSDSVWEKIEVRIEKRKRSRRGLFLFVLFFCFFLAGGYLLWNTRYHSSTGNTNSKKNYSEKNTHEIPVIHNNNTGAINNLDPGLITKKIHTVGNAHLKNNINKNSSQHYETPAAKKIIKINSGESVLPAMAQEKEGMDISEKIKPGTGQLPEIRSENEKIEEEQEESTSNKIKPGILLKPNLEDDAAKVKDTSKQAQTTTGKISHTRKNKWKPGILFSGGISGVGNNFLGLVNTPAYDYLTPMGPGTIQTARGSPSKTKSGFGFIAGVFAEKNIFPGTKLVLGINFTSFNTTNKVGLRNDTTGYYYLQNTVNKTYRNQYSFIELPVTLKVQVGRGKNLPVFWQGGFIVSELFSSNALQFNPTTGLYYKDNSIFNKTQIGLSTALSVALFSKQKKSILIGPYFYYTASRLANEGLYNKKHFVFTGLRTEIIFGK